MERKGKRYTEKDGYTEREINTDRDREIYR